jgi:cobalt-zinc-cadmium efflux system membrane fusion protein
MSTTLRRFVRSSLFGAFVITFGLGCSSGPSSSTAKETPAKIQNPRTEADLSTITLSPEAVKRLGIETVVARQDVAASTRTLGGEVVVPEGRSVIVTAPVAGTLIGSTAPLPGARVRKGDPLMAIAPLVSADRDQRIEAQRALSAAEAEELAARQRLQRLEQLLKDGAASVRGVEEARAQHQVTVAAVTAARDRLAGVSRNPVGEQGELIVSAPFDGVVQRVSAVPGQTVAASASLLEIAHVDTLWVRVSIYAGDASQIDHAQHVSVTRLGDAGTPARGTPVVAPLRGDPAAASVELHYAVAQVQSALRPGERVLVELPMKSTTRGLVVPDAAVLYDIHGATWVYEDLGSNAYARRRVEVARHAGDRVIVNRGISEGAKVVTTGAPELFGTEFGAGH